MDVKNILLVGVGGQGTVSAGRVLARAAFSLGGEVKVADVHGMAQRGGSVVTQVRFGSQVFSPIISPGTAHFLLAMEKLEALRWVHYLRPQGWLIAADIEIPPLPVLLGRESYPPRLEEELRKRVSRFMLLPARELAASAGNPRAANMVLLGALSLFLPISLEDWEQAMEACLPPRLWEVNRRAFCLGRERASALQEENAF